jgi:hypothetical protein
MANGLLLFMTDIDPALDLCWDFGTTSLIIRVRARWRGPVFLR